MQYAKHVKWRSEKFGAVVFDTLNEKVFVTNETGDDILRLLHEGRSAAETVARLQEKYIGNEAQVESDVGAFIGQLQSAGLLASAVRREA